MRRRAGELVPDDLVDQAVAVGLDALARPNQRRTHGQTVTELAQHGAEGMAGCRQDERTRSCGRVEIVGGVDARGELDAGQIARVLLLEANRVEDTAVAAPQGDAGAVARHGGGQGGAPRTGTDDCHPRGGVGHAGPAGAWSPPPLGGWRFCCCS